MEPEIAENKKSLLHILQRAFKWFEIILSIAISLLLAGLLVEIVMRLYMNAYALIFSRFLHPNDIATNNFSEIYGRIIYILITIEFMNSVIRALKGRTLEGPVKDVMLITALAIGRKLIVMEYAYNQAGLIFANSSVLVALGIFYFLINFHKKSTGNLNNGDSFETRMPKNKK